MLAGWGKFLVEWNINSALRAAMWQRQTKLSIHKSSNPGKHLHTCPKRHVKGNIFQHHMRKNLETPEMLVHRYLSAMEYNVALKRIRNLLA